jgi:hypothetical protein
MTSQDCWIWGMALVSARVAGAEASHGGAVQAAVVTDRTEAGNPP